MSNILRELEFESFLDGLQDAQWATSEFRIESPLRSAFWLYLSGDGQSERVKRGHKSLAVTIANKRRFGDAVVVASYKKHCDKPGSIFRTMADTGRSYTYVLDALKRSGIAHVPVKQRRASAPHHRTLGL